MKNLFDHIERIKGKPHHVRKQIAFGAAAGLSAFIALVWFAGSIATGAFAIRNTSFAANTAQENTVATTSASGDQGLAGAAAAVQDANAPAHIEIVDTGAAAPAKSTPTQTILPF
ncbi:MAG TPA: hypothetical protein VMV62_00615 [Candidatus Paceibacterota bacterium]|nr:hypothetical protein [Candidatus Paceibacterota bacterium]